MSSLTNQGYSYVYNETYSHYTTKSEMETIKSSCLPSTVLCLGGRDSTNDVLLVVSCGLCSVVLTPTARVTPNLHNGAYWYYTPNYSMGFAPNATIYQNQADNYDQSNNQRVSWDLDDSGGWRLGSLTSSLNYNSRYYKVILKR